MKLRDSGRNLHAALHTAAREDPSAPLVTFLGDRTYTRGELLESSLRAAAGLRAAGVGHGDRVALMMSNRVEFLTTYFALSQLGAVSVPLNTALRGDVLDYMLESVAPCRLVTEAAFTEQLAPAVVGRAGVGHVWSVDTSGALPGALPFAELASRAPLEDVVHPQPWELASILFTSGTTGPSKGVMWSHNLGICLAENSCWVMAYTGNDVIYTCLPLFHINALFTAFYAGLLVGAPVVVAPRFSASSFWREIGDNGATVANMLGAMGAILWRQEPALAERNHRLRLSMVVPFPKGYTEEFEERFQLTATELYGSTDTGIPLGIPFGERRPGSCGVPAPGWECLLVDEDDEPVAQGEVGELVVRPTRPFVGQLGYWNLPERTLEAHRNQWFHTGDALWQDADGWYYFADRKKDALRVSGENVSSFEVEQVLLSHPSVLEAAVYAVPSELGEDSVMAAVVLDPETPEMTPQQLRNHVVHRLPYFAVPRYIDVRSVLPKTATEKVRKAGLRDEGLTATTWDAGPQRRPR
jgi:crotonobetaine/carnitine-CoA ligase